MNSELSSYVAFGRLQIDGWFSRFDAEVFRAILEHQSARQLSGAAAEIGVHHGRSFVAACLGLRDGEKAYCIDIFDAQHLNVDQSGSGDRQLLERNLERFGVDRNRVVIDARLSTDVRADDILNSVGRIRLFSIDGGHRRDLVKSDLTLAERTLLPYGVVALDDFHRPEWPDVSGGYYDWEASSTGGIVPLAIGFNKLYLCASEWKPTYTRLLQDDRFLKHFWKTKEFSGAPILVGHEFAFPEWPVFQKAKKALKWNRPDLFVRLKGWC